LNEIIKGSFSKTVSRIHPGLKQFALIGFYILLTFAMRLSSFAYSAIDWDESLYFLMAKTLLDGAMPYEVVWDHKPVGIYILFAVSQMLFGDSVTSIRILAVLVIAITAYILHRITVFVTKDLEFSGFLAGVFYIAFSLKNGGLASNTEIHFAPFVAAAFYLLVRLIQSENRMAHRFVAILAGTLMGIAFQIKYIVIFEIIIIGTALALFPFRIIGSWMTRSLKILKICSLFSFFFILPTLLVVIAYAAFGNLGDWFYANIEANAVHAGSNPFDFKLWAWVVTDQIRNNSIIWIAPVVMPIYIFIQRGKSEGQETSLWIIFAWWVGSLTAASATRLYYGHYFLQMLPAATIMSAIIFAYLVKTVLSRSTRLVSRVFIATVLLAITVNLSCRCLDGLSNSICVVKEWVEMDSQWLDIESELAFTMKKELTEGDFIFVVNGQIILYHLTGAEMPSKFVFPLFFRSEHFSRVAGIDPDGEILSILQKKPKFIVIYRRREMVKSEELHRALTEEYILFTAVNGIEVYEFKKEPGQNSRGRL
jgi:4-amino-4-deoxy-L-arabinose transferase-like glycosyltransferase